MSPDKLSSWDEPGFERELCTSAHFLLSQLSFPNHAMQALYLQLVKNSPYKIQRLVFIPHTPGGPALIEQMSVVYRSMGSNGVFTSVTSLGEKHHCR